jgi:hypothetical protein
MGSAAVKDCQDCAYLEIGLSLRENKPTLVCTRLNNIKYELARHKSGACGPDAIYFVKE